MSKITSCKNCAFARYDGITQKGCTAKRLFTLRRAGLQIKKAYDNEKEFFIIGGPCAFWRPAQWLDSLPTDEDPIIRARAELSLPCQALLIANNSIKDTIESYLSLTQQQIKPWRITVIFPLNNKLPYKTVAKLIKTLHNNIPWRTERIVNPEYTSEHRIIDLALRHKPLQFFSVFKAGLPIPLNTFKILGDKIIDELWKFVILLPNDKGHGLIAPYNIYHYWKLNGNHTWDLPTNILSNSMSS